jgi:Zn-dependent protease with chaperone function
VWQRQEYEADSWAASIGWAPELAEFLQTHVLELDHPIPLEVLSSHSHPPTELRIDKLRQSPQTPPPSTPATAPVWIEGEPA